ncbi:hypothetical protein L596_008802 [Steinernema carpocapsae]|uniref:Uncharacterized protein n=1 Tax=Steinernema carpocapsae TaxID=34508 RepID=A0A4U5PDP1_STECR|nr:hypothetical protein L596_008802 [Steinernema carpocapsae]
MVLTSDRWRAGSRVNPACEPAPSITGLDLRLKASFVNSVFRACTCFSDDLYDQQVSKIPHVSYRFRRLPFFPMARTCNP